MQRGAFALLDCLGFKGIWKRHADANLIVSKLREIKRDSANIIRRGLGSQWASNALEVDLAFVSDSVAISVRGHRRFAAAPDPQNDTPGFCIFGAGNLVIEIADQFRMNDPALLLRGCITFGEHICEDAFFLGPAVDEAASMLNLADAALVWLSPHTNRIYGEFGERMAQYSREILKDGIDPISYLLEYQNHVHGAEQASEMSKIFSKLPSATQDGVRKVLLEAIIKTDIANSLFISDYPVPLKEGRRLRTRVVNPLLNKRPNEVEPLVRRILSTMESDEIDVVVKRQHTADFLQHAVDQDRRITETLEQIAGKHLRLLTPNSDPADSTA